MGVQITELLPRKEIAVSDLKDKIIAVDSSLFLYQFLSTIRQRDGTQLMDSEGNITSHLSGLFFRSINLMKRGVKLVYVFDGKSHDLKAKEHERRNRLKDEAQKRYDLAKQEQDIEEMAKYAKRTSKLTPGMIEEAKELISYLGLPMIEAPSEAEAQAAYMVKKGDCYGVATQDSDSLMFGAPRLIRNLSLLGKRKKTKTLSYQKYSPEIVDLSEVLNNLGIDNDQFIVLCMLVGTDFNYGGIKGIGPKNALKLLQKHGKDFGQLFKEAGWDDHFDFDWTEVFYLIKKMPATDDYELVWKDVNETRLLELMEKRDFSRERIESSLSDYLEMFKEKQQRTIFDYD